LCAPRRAFIVGGITSARRLAMSNRDIARAFIAAWNSHSPEAVCDLFAPGGRLRDASNPEDIGGAEIAASVKRALERFPDIAFTLLDVVDGADGRTAFEWRMTATATAADGRKVPVTMDGCDVCQVKDGKIVELHGYFDRAAIMAKLSA
jgi:ketosteroid isomerase-like protein